MTDFQEQQPQQPYYPPQPPRPPYEPTQPMRSAQGPYEATQPAQGPYGATRPITTEPGTTIWPSGGHVPPPVDPPLVATVPAPAPSPRRRAKRGVGLMAAVAIAAAAVGGGTATLVQQLTSDTVATASSPVVSGTNVSTGSKGTVAGVAEAVSPPSWRSPRPRTPASPPARA